jgi:death on curing protein
VKFVDKTSVLIIHRKLIDQYGGLHGLRDEGALESAVNSAENRYNYDTEDIAKLAATCAYHLSQAHAFLDGNKRIAAAVVGVFLEINGAFLNASETEIINVFLEIADGKLSRDEVESRFQDWLEIDQTSK